MLYKKNASEHLSPELFQNPTSEYRAAPFWAWNGKLDKEELKRQIGHFQEMGFGGFHMHSRTGLATEYLSDEFMDMVEVCCDEAEARQMLAWLYDEDRWPSGSAGGIVTKNKAYRRKSLMFSLEDRGWDYQNAQIMAEGESYLLGVYDIVLDEEGYLESYRCISREEEAVGTKWFAYCAVDWTSPWFNGQAYCDALDRETVETFLQVTYERYKDKVGDRFGGVVPAVFTDEPNVRPEARLFAPTPLCKNNIKFAWTYTFGQEYEKKYGGDVAQLLPLLPWITRDGSDKLFKYRYFDLVAQMFSQNLWKQIGDWCKDNGIAFTGHFRGETTLEEQAVTSGEMMRHYQYKDIPGVDMLCAHRELLTAKQCQSAVHQYGKEGMLSELYGVTNWDFDFRGHKLDGDWQAALGVTVRVPHLAWYTMKGEGKRDYPAAIGYQSPWYGEYAYIEDHFARVNTAMTRGKPIVKIGMIHPIESYWISCGPISQTTEQISALERNIADVTGWLLENHLDFDFICEATLPEQLDANAPRKVGQMEYEAVIVPGCIGLRSTTVEYLKTFRENGGKVIFMGACPDYLDGIRSEGCRELFARSQHVSFDSASLCKALEQERCIRILNSRGNIEDKVLYGYRQDKHNNWLFIACFREFMGKINKVEYCKPQRDDTEYDPMTIVISGEFVPTLYDTLTGQIRPMQYQHKNGNTQITHPFIECDSLLIHLDPNGVAAAAEAEEKLQPVKKWDIKGLVDYTLSEPNVLLLDRAKYSYDGGAWQEEEEILRITQSYSKYLGCECGEIQPYLLPRQPAEHTLGLQFTLCSTVDIRGASLALEDAATADIFLNGVKVENNITGYFTDRDIGTVPLPEIPAGENVLEIVYPFGMGTCVEWCYLLGDFGVRVMGSQSLLVERQRQLGFSDVTAQTLPFYGANVSYQFDVELEEDGALEIETSYYRGSLIAVELDGKREGRIVFPPYKLMLRNVKKGKHTVTLTLFGNRHNCFGALHKVNDGDIWYEPKAWRTQGSGWCYEYKLRPFGILKSPVITVYKNQ